MVSIGVGGLTMGSNQQNRGNGMNRLFALIGATLVAAGCADRGVVDVSMQQADQPSANLVGDPGSPGITVMTWNVYYGTDPKIVLQAQSTDEVPIYAAQVWALLQQTNFPERAEALAGQIAAKHPHLVGVQEAALWRIQHPSDFVTGTFAPNATTVQYDFLTLLTDALEQRGLHYVVAAVDETSDLEVPMVTGFDPSSGYTFDDIRLTDRDAVLVREDVAYGDPTSSVYGAAIPIELGAGLPTIYIREGWSSVVATVAGQSYRFVSTHLEIQDLPGVGDYVQYLQAQELLGVLSDEALPTILVGDFNSDVASGDPAKTRSYDLITASGFQDTWLRPFQSPPGFTCCQSDDLSNLLSTFSQRVDFIFTRDMPQTVPAASLVLARAVLGDRPGDRTPSGLWPSDHGGVVATFLVPPVGPRTSVVAE
jgi:hypothetical protein